MHIFGKCPLCGGNILEGYGKPYCENHCGFMMFREYRHRKFTDEQVSDVLEGKRILLPNTDGSCIWVEPVGVEEYSYTSRDGIPSKAKRVKYRTKPAPGYYYRDPAAVQSVKSGPQNPFNSGFPKTVYGQHAQSIPERDVPVQQVDQLSPATSTPVQSDPHCEQSYELPDDIPNDLYDDYYPEEYY